jgi:ribosomal-protein-alanine N-acetyltransferase
MSGVAIVAAGVEHARLMAAIHRICFAEPWDEAAIAQLIGLPGTFGLLAHSAAEGPAGMLIARVAADESEILSIAVLPPFRRQGIGRLLMARAWESARASGAASLFLEVAAGNDAARALYGNLGFLEVGRRPRYYADGTDAFLLRLNL